MRPSPRFSIVTITYNNLHGLQKTATSVLAQRFADFEWIVVDGLSTDGTKTYLEQLQRPRVTVISERDDGIFHAMQKGLNLASGEYVCFMNAGDCFAGADVLSRIDESIGADEPALIYGDAIEAESAKQFYKPARRPSENRYVMFTHHQAQLYRRLDAEALGGYDLTYSLSADWVLTTRILRSNRSLRLPFAVCIFERGGISQRSDKRRVLNTELFRIYREEQHHSLLWSCVLWTAKVGVNKLRQLAPKAYDIIRYRTSGQFT